MNDSFQNDESFREFLSLAFSNANDHLTEGGCFYIFYAGRYCYEVLSACRDNEWCPKHLLVWKKDSLVLGRSDYQYIHEPFVYGWKEGGTHTWNNDRKQTSVVEFARPKMSKLHPTMKPLDLFGYLIKNSSNKKENVLDLFGGSGTTLITCEQLERNAYLMELDPKYVNVIIKRWEEYTGKKAVKVNE